MRTTVLILATLAFMAGLIIEPAALLQIARFCLRGRCGVRPLWIELGGAAVMVAFVVAIIIDRWEPPPPPVKRKPRAKPDAGAVTVKRVPPRARRVRKPRDPTVTPER